MSERGERFVALHEALDPVGSKDALRFYVQRPAHDVSKEIASSIVGGLRSHHFLYSAIGADE